MRVVEEGRDKMVLRGRVGDVGIEQVFTAVPANGDKPCTVDLAVTWTNQGGSPLVDGLVVSAHDSFPAGGGMMARYQSVHRPLAFADDDLVTPDVTEIETLADRSPIEGPVGWFGIGDRYFMLMAMPVEAGGTLELSGLPGGEAGLLTGFDYTALAPGLAAGASHTSNFHVYIGPLDLDVVGTISKDLTYAVDLGWFAFFAYPLLWLLKRIHSVIGDWGFSIVVLTLFVKALFFPMTQAAFKSTQAMQALNPVMTKIREDYKDQPEEMNRRIMELFKENKVNPLGGCLPMLVQFPVWIALYNVLLSSVELYHTRFLYLADLSSVDPYCVLPAVVVGLMVIQQRFAPTGNLDPAQARMMKLMPLVFGVFFFTFPSGLVVYIFVNMSLSILQQWWIKRSFGEPGAEPATT
jgi:YidC/Oxa1 family membrane protein insertase